MFLEPLTFCSGFFDEYKATKNSNDNTLTQLLTGIISEVYVTLKTGIMAEDNSDFHHWNKLH